MNAVTAAEMRELDRRTIEERGIPGEVLMAQAGWGVAQKVLDVLENLDGAQSVQMFAGKGNNGGDVFAAAVFLDDAGVDVEVFFAGRVEDIKGDARAALERMYDSEIELRELKSVAEWQQLKVMPHLAGDVLVDGLLGTGIKGAARGVSAAAIEVVNHFADIKRAPVVAVDIPSGMNADSGESEGVVVRADYTVTMGLAKRGMLQPAALESVGNLSVVDIGIPAEYARELNSDIELIAAADIAEMFPRRRRVAHKGDFGHVLLIGGAPGYVGAIILAARAALRSGVGLVSMLVPETVAAIAAGAVPEAMVHSALCNKEGSLSAGALEGAAFDVTKFAAVLVGPGMSRNPEGAELIRKVAQMSKEPLVLDADALNLLAEDNSLADAARGRLVLTPHPGEAGRLLGRTAADVQADRFGAAADLAECFGACAVLKGAGTVVREPGGVPYVSLAGNPGMAKGGSGDLLAGLLGGIGAQGLSVLDAARAAVYIHGAAGDIAAGASSQPGMTVADIIEAIPQVWKKL